MDYFDIVKRGFKIAWEHKHLWLLGFFAAGAASTPGSNARMMFQGGGDQGSTAELEPLARWAEANVGLLVVAAGVLVALMFLMFVLSVAAHGGLVWATNEAAEGRRPRLREAWGAGFRCWGRTFMIGLSLFSPLVVLIVVLFAALFVPLVSAIERVPNPDAAAGIGVGSFFCGLPLLVVLTAVASVLVGLLFMLALRYGVLDDRGFGQSIQAAWRDVWGKRGAWAMWAVMLLPSFVYGAVFGVVGLLLVVPAAFAIYAGRVITGAGVIVLAALILAVPQAAYATFTSAAWTIFFRRITGREAEPQRTPSAHPGQSTPGGASWQQSSELLPPPPPAPPAAPPAPAESAEGPQTAPSEAPSDGS
ncbi:hypothetical protein MX659_07955 [Coriobacteriia bacterium Es71-Z0120]|uniref:DUF7544 domain-containing protein n=1 Tax=Parvivirga hydrogeniphila TaxID=2939460 RepID=UPI002260BB7E|nr:hypothetical protein [Parvivirga hydrogeniphila]MCL4079513.1 hypothetical protein [Parvivirga hydrogeniphila]